MHTHTHTHTHTQTHQTNKQQTKHGRVFATHWSWHCKGIKTSPNRLSLSSASSLCHLYPDSCQKKGYTKQSAVCYSGGKKWPNNLLLTVLGQDFFLSFLSFFSFFSPFLFFCILRPLRRMWSLPHAQNRGIIQQWWDAWVFLPRSEIQYEEHG